jgi:hypothetical protein
MFATAGTTWLASNAVSSTAGHAATSGEPVAGADVGVAGAVETGSAWDGETFGDEVATGADGDTGSDAWAAPPPQAANARHAEPASSANGRMPLYSGSQSRRQYVG